MPDTLQSLKGFPLERIVALALEQSRDATGGDAVYDVAVVDMDGDCLFRASMRTDSHDATSADAAEAVSRLQEKVSPDSLVVVFDDVADWRVLTALGAEETLVDASVFSLVDEYAIAHGYAKSLADVAAHYGHDTDASGALACARVLAQCCRSLMQDKEYTRHQTHMPIRNGDHGTYESTPTKTAGPKTSPAVPVTPATPPAAQAPAPQEAAVTPGGSGKERLDLERTIVLPRPHDLEDAVGIEPKDTTEPETTDEHGPEDELDTEVETEVEAEVEDEAKADAGIEAEPVAGADATLVFGATGSHPADGSEDAPVSDDSSETEPETEGGDGGEARPVTVDGAEVAAKPDADASGARDAEAGTEKDATPDQAAAADEPPTASPDATEEHGTKTGSRRGPKGLSPNAKIIVLAAIAFGLLIAVCAISLNSCPASQNADVSAEAGGEVKTYAFFDEVVAHVPTTWKIDDSDERWTNIYPDNDGYIHIQIENHDDDPATEKMAWESFLKGVESGGSATIDRELMKEINVGDALRHRYPITVKTDSGSFGGHMDVTLTGSKVVSVIYTYKDKDPRDVRDVTCKWLDDVQYLDTTEPAFVVDEMVIKELEADTTSLSHAGLTLELPDTWHQFDRDEEGQDRYSFRNNQGCIGFIEYDKGAAAKEDDYESAKEHYFEKLSKDFTVDEDSVRDVKAQKAKGFAFDATYEAQVPYATTYEVLYSGDDMFVLYIGIPKDKSRGMDKVIDRCLKSVEVFGAKAPNFKLKETEKKDKETEKEKEKEKDQKKDKEEEDAQDEDEEAADERATRSTSTQTSQSQSSKPQTSAQTSTSARTTSPSQSTTQSQPTQTSQPSQPSQPSQTTQPQSPQAPEPQPSQTTYYEPDPQSNVVEETQSQYDALTSALSYLSNVPLSRERLIEQLESDGFENQDALWAADQCNVDWYEQAAVMAERLLGGANYSQTELEEQLRVEGFTSDQATYGVQRCGADWYAQAANRAITYLSEDAYEHDELVNLLEQDGFTFDEATYGAESAGL